MKQVLRLSVATLWMMFGLWACGGTGGDGAPSVMQPPEVVSVFPQPDDNAASAAAAVSATFDQDMSPASAGSFSVHGSLSGRLSGIYSGGGTPTLSFEPAANYRPGEEVEVALTQFLTSTGGVELDQPYVYRFVVAVGGGTGIFLDAQTIVNQFNAIAVTAGDWDGDGDLDLAVANFGGDSVTILKNDGAGNFSESGRIAPQVGASAIAAGDWDGDGDLDLAVANFGSNSVAVLTNDGIGVFAPATVVPDMIGVRAWTGTGTATWIWPWPISAPTASLS